MKVTRLPKWKGVVGKKVAQQFQDNAVRQQAKQRSRQEEADIAMYPEEESGMPSTTDCPPSSDEEVYVDGKRAVSD